MAIFIKQGGAWGAMSCSNPSTAISPKLKVGGAWVPSDVTAVGSFPLGVWVRHDKGGGPAWREIQAFNPAVPDC